MEKLNNVTADTLMRQATLTAGTYMNRAVEEIDEKFGKGFAKANPSLISSFMITASNDYFAGSQLAGLQEIAEAIRLTRSLNAEFELDKDAA